MKLRSVSAGLAMFTVAYAMAAPPHTQPDEAGQKVEALGAPKNLGTCEGYTIYQWPKVDKGVSVPADRAARLKAVEAQMNLYSKTVGTCYNRKPKGKSEKAWINTERDRGTENLNSKSTTREYCNAVKVERVNKLMPRSKSDPSPYCQYGNCEEGAEVGACLAFDYGFSENEIKICESEPDHAWALVPKSAGSSEYCLLDRWNAFRCGVQLKGKWDKSTDEFTGTVVVPGKTEFNFNNANCLPLKSRTF